MKIKTHGMKPAVYRLAIHDKDQQPVLFNPDDDPIEVQNEAERLSRTRLTQYFYLNKPTKIALAAGNPIPYLQNPLRVRKRVVMGRERSCVQHDLR